jgi:hypothetical protein
MERPVGVRRLRDLQISALLKQVSDVNVKNVIPVYVEEHAGEVAQIIGRCNQQFYEQPPGA